jgi:hypothetical protein
MDYLLYWKTFWSEHGDRGPIRAEWPTDRRWLWEKASRGDRYWVVIAAPKKEPGHWRLLQKLEVARRDSNVGKGDRKFRIVGDRTKSRVFDFADRRPDAAAVLKRLEFSSGRPITRTGTGIGRSIRTPRRLTPADVKKMEKFAARLRCLS